MSNNSPVLEFKSSTFFAPILILFNNDIVDIEEALAKKIKLAPEFFKDSPLIVDLTELNKHAKEIDFNQVIQLLRRVGFFPVGVRGGNEQQNKQARELFIPIDTVRELTNLVTTDEKNNSDSTLQTNQQTVTPEIKQETVSAVVPPTRPAYVPATLVTQPIRSGQRVYATGDLVVMSQVSAGAEIMAEGNIHVYNTLRGRALAGVHGNTAARIFCSDMQAELISIAGDYKTSEDLNKQTYKNPVQIYLQNHALIIQEIV